MRPLLGKYFTVVVKLMWGAVTGLLDPNAAAAALANPAAAAAAVAAAAADPAGAARKLAQQAEDSIRGALGIKPACTNPELIDPQTEKGNPVTEDATRVYQPINTSQGFFGYIYVDGTRPAQYQTDSKYKLRNMILAAAFLVITTGGLYRTYSI